MRRVERTSCQGSRLAALDDTAPFALASNAPIRETIAGIWGEADTPDRAETTSRIAEWFLPSTEGEQEIDVTRRVALVLLIALFGLACGAFFGLYYLLILGNSSMGGAILAAAVAVATVPLILRATGSLTLAAHLLAGVLLAIVAVASVSREGFTLSSLAFAFAIPLFTAYIGSFRVAVFWGLAAVALFIAMYLRARFGYPIGPFAELERESALTLDLFAMIGTMLLLFGLAYVQERSRLFSERTRAKTEERLRLSQKMESVGQLAGGVAHDFNNLLTVIMTVADMIHDDHGEDPELSEDIKEIRKAALHGSEMVQQLLLFSRKEVARISVVDLNQIVDETEPLIRRSLREDIELRLSLADDLWHTSVNHGQMKQVLVNLAVNARDAMPTGGTLHIETQNRELREDTARAGDEIVAGPYAVLTVGDTGSGMQRDVADRVFEPFYTTKKKGVGTGMGLATAYGIVRSANGYIWVDSALEQGTTFTICLPATDAALSKNTQSSLVSGIVPRGGATILLVEDDAAVRHSVERILNRAGYTVHVAASGEDADDVWKRHGSAIDLLLSDIVMPGVSGPELARRLKSQSKILRVLFMTGYAHDAVADVHGLEIDAPLLRKPFSEAKLLERIRIAVSPHGPTIPPA